MKSRYAYKQQEAMSNAAQAEYLGDITPEAGDDYANNMFRDGRNRTERNRRAHNAPDYDTAAHTGEAPAEFVTTDGLPQSLTSFHSREGTDAAGKYDETGGPLGGTEAELDSLESCATPVDKNPRMKD
jgi:hypothetical protein